jgi:hypothetical protein
MIPTTDRLESALLYHRLGLKVLKVRGKNPDVMGLGWQSRPTTEADLHAWFGNGACYNLGIQMGAASNNTGDVDLDTKAAVRVADHFLPPTGWVFGREGHPSSHREYQVDRVGPNLKLCDPLKERDSEKAVIVELRGNNLQTVFPPSVHVDTGQVIRWERSEEPARVAWEDLAGAVYRIGAAALLARYAPGEGVRHDFALALGGALAHAGYPLDKAKRLVEAVAHGMAQSWVTSR